jgi:hypothetical protein
LAASVSHSASATPRGPPPRPTQSAPTA